MEITFDPAKNERNIRERGISCERVADFDFETALYAGDTRKDYGEIRTRAFGYLDGRLHALVFTERNGGIRVVRFRKANKREIEKYEKAPEQEAQP